MQYNTDIINHLIRNRRSVFPDQFDTGKQIPDEIIDNILINATWAPTHGQNEPWHFSVYTGSGIKQLASFQSELYKQESGSKFTASKYIKLLNAIQASRINKKIRSRS